MIVWPKNIPLPQFGMGYSVDDPQSRVKFLSGRTMVRRRYSDVPTSFSAKWILTTYEAFLFESFYQDTSKNGTEWMLMDLVVPMGRGDHYVRFMGGYSSKRVGPDLWEFGAQMQMYLRPSSPQIPPGNTVGPEPEPSYPYEVGATNARLKHRHS